MYANKKQRGFIALISAIIISVVLLIAAVAGSLTGMYMRFGILDSEFKEKSAALADACVSVLLYKVGQDSSYAGPDMNYAVGSDTCNIFASSNPSSNPRNFKVQGIYQNTYTNLFVSVDTDTATLVTLQETAQ